MRYFYAYAALFAATAIAGPTGLRSTPEAENVENANDLIDLGALTGSGINLKREENAQDDAIDLGILTDSNNKNNNYGGSGISLKRNENAQDNGIGPIEIGSPILDIDNL